MSPYTKLPLDLGTLHFLGIGGIGMSGIAELMLNLGHSVSGSDLRETATTLRLVELGAKIFIGHSSKNINNVSAVVVSSAIKNDNCEVIAARTRGIPIVRRSEMLAELMRLKSNIAVAGTHGKTTTTSMIAALLDSGNLDPTVINGGIIQAYGSNARMGAGDWMVVEADESDGTFVKIPATIAVVTNIDREHLDYYKSFRVLKETFSSFIEKIPFYGLGVCCIDDSNVQKIVARIQDRRLVTYGFNNQADLRIENVSFTGGIANFDLVSRYKGKINGLCLPMTGKHNVLNATAAIGVALHLGVSKTQVKNGLNNFEGVKRRFTKVCSWNKIDIIDDYGHHPVEIKAVLEAARQATAGRVITVHQPHRYSRINDLFEEFCSCFNEADIVGITEVYGAGEKPIKDINQKRLIDGLGTYGHKAVYAINGEDDMHRFLVQHGLPGDIFVCLGAGSISAWVNNLAHKLNIEKN